MRQRLGPLRVALLGPSPFVGAAFALARRQGGRPMQRLTRSSLWMRGRGVGLAAGLMAVTLPSGLLMGGQLAGRQTGPSERHSRSRAVQAVPDRSRPHWGRPDLASLKLLRDAVAEEANRTFAAVAGGDARARGGGPGGR